MADLVRQHEGVVVSAGGTLGTEAFLGELHHVAVHFGKVVAYVHAEGVFVGLEDVAHGLSTVIVVLADGAVVIRE